MTYFDKKAKTYLLDSRRGLWHHIRSLEQRVVFELLSVQPGETVLDVGCGPGYYAQKLQTFGAAVMGIDSSRAMIDQFRALGFNGVVGRFENYSFTQEFDKILIAGAAEFVEDLEGLLSQITNGLKAGGKAVVLAPRRNGLGWIYKLWHGSHGCAVYLHDYPTAIRKSSTLNLV